jgi:SAM-dependent methyltransferase
MPSKQISQTIIANLMKGLNRRDAVAQAMPCDAHILEIGPGGYPLFQKSSFPNLKITDCYEYDPALPHFPKVDYICGDGNLTSIIPAELKFDLIFTSHNIEHQPNPILHLQNVEALLSDDGVAVFAVPDKRFTFDVFRHTTTTSDLLLAYQEGRSAPSAKALFDSKLQTVTRNFTECRRIGMDDSVTLGDPLAAHRCFLEHGSSSEYVDVHNWIFTPKSFQILITELYLLRLSSLMFEFLSDGMGNAFLSIMAKKPFPSDENAAASLDLILREQLLDGYKKMVFAGG